MTELWEAYCDQKEVVAELKAENAKLREALELCVTALKEVRGMHYTVTIPAAKAIDAARAALGDGK